MKAEVMRWVFKSTQEPKETKVEAACQRQLTRAFGGMESRGVQWSWSGDPGEAPGWAPEGLRSVGPREGTVSSEPLCLVCKMKLRKEKWSQLFSCVQRWPECNWRQLELPKSLRLPHPTPLAGSWICPSGYWGKVDFVHSENTGWLAVTYTA